jgi:transposase
MAKKLVSDELWEVIEPLLPEEPPKPNGGRPRIDDRAALTGNVFVLKSGIPWEMLPQEMGRGSGMTCWRRLKEWHEAGVWEELHRTLLDRLGKADEIDWERASLDSASVAAPGGQTGLEAPHCGRPRRHPTLSLRSTRPPTYMIRRSCKRPWTSSSLSADLGAGHANVPRSSTLMIKLMTSLDAARRSGREV